MFVNGRRGNHKSQAFDFRIGCKLNDDRTFQFCFSRNENIGVFTINWHFSKWCVSKVPQYTYMVFACSIKCWSHLLEAFITARCQLEANGYFFFLNCTSVLITDNSTLMPITYYVTRCLI